MQPSLALMLVAAAIPAFATPVRAEDGSGPRAALLMYDKMVGPHEADRAIGLYHATNTRERAVAAVLAKIDGSLANLRKQAVAKFGADAANSVLRAVKATTATDINAAQITVAGDTASVEFPDNDGPTEMVRVNDEWKISVRAMMGGPRANPRAFRRAITQLNAAVDDVAAKVQQGQYSTPKEPIAKLEAAYKAQFRPLRENDPAGN